MRTAYTSDQIRTAERALMARLPDGTLMQRAAAGLAVHCAAELRRARGVYGSRVAVLAGGGDNGGDALYAGARLAARGARVDAVLAGSRTHEGGLAALRAAGGRAVPAGSDAARRAVERADLIVDGLVGIGGSGALRPPYAELVSLAGGARGRVVAVDVPSGVAAGTGEVEGPAVRAAVTVTFGALKTGLLTDPGAEHAGRVELVDIGLGPYLPGPDATALTDADVAERLPRPGAESDKYRRGVVGVAAGGARFTGAAVLAVGGAVRSGAGLVRYAGQETPVGYVRDHWPEAVVTTLAPGQGVEEVGRVQAWVVGPGLGTDDDALAVARSVLATCVPVVVDADALTLVAREPSLLRRGAPVLLTPHAGELSRLLGVPREAIEERRVEHAREAAARLGVTVLLKGSTTVVAEEGLPVRVNATGTPWLATGGTGDVLSGVAGTLLAAGLSCYDAGSCAAHLHGSAARIAADGAPIAAGDVAGAIPAAIRAVLGGGTGRHAASSA
ncbi:bifunctional NAD(P)H-hydrate repair enzyme [Microtetraspora sp. NBRC 13810]|uniref:NAD(P)H-hydrate dehydratase n=1 Tax=Microtetraspora sp. NBRC 13810 TaxID=3030990 RepID=UPI0024A5D917|nr:NAD(P)H-hydrate dehydratase [Microtetraspora sp. NBRC 13810]GLW05593.1 bifunctional NAD(P)H-hydrate repair enzyme [Microtetraspora sp. NBRC 13810]